MCIYLFIYLFIIHYWWRILKCDWTKHKCTHNITLFVKLTVANALNNMSYPKPPARIPSKQLPLSCPLPSIASLPLIRSICPPALLNTIISRRPPWGSPVLNHPSPALCVPPLSLMWLLIHSWRIVLTHHDGKTFGLRGVLSHTKPKPPHLPFKNVSSHYLHWFFNSFRPLKRLLAH